MIILIKKLFIKVISVSLTVYLLLIAIGLFYSDALIFLPRPASYHLSDDLVTVPTETVNKDDDTHHIVIRHLHQANAKYTILYSHGNAVDIGGLINVQQKFFDHGYSIIIYDYSGYGHSESSASEQQVYNDVQAVYDYLTRQQNIRAEDIISYGHSLGAAVATELAVKNQVAALILESPFTTAFRVKTIYPIAPFDKFASIDKIDKISAPVLISHSRDDPVISFWHGEELFKQANNPKISLWFEQQGHSGITHTEKFWQRLNIFTSEVGAE